MLLKKFGHFDLVSFDCNGGVLDTKWATHHMTLLNALDFFEVLERNGNVDDKTIKVASHISHNSDTLHYQLEEGVKKYGIIAAYDGLEIEF